LKKYIKFSEPSFCHCEERSDAATPSFPYVIPAQAGIHPSVIANFRRKCGNLIIPLYLSSLFIILFLTRILQLVFYISFYFFIISSRTYNPNPLFLYKLNTKYQRLMTNFNNYTLFLCNIPLFSAQIL